MTQYVSSWKCMPVDLGETIILGGAFTDPAEIERMQAAMRRTPIVSESRVYWNGSAWVLRPAPPKPRRYCPSLMAHRPG